ncbi:MAG: STAS domain-containing protein [Roseiflexus sp.]|jgi:rsbT co-antagonist protein RsbR|nr:STAS domain-containing protein [Roseiflexus sp.]MBO9341999.1 STAS domain-containing protein [Roseiflexus sp.]MBO9365564.1 STAS domain-containing protein [Roseiflexus sp.]MBO9381632.1 STAS domain-containing protein [Roseiflexus sp.]MBO9387479.1 STAS domain-containing protein [Roseiflexus sp.]
MINFVLILLSMIILTATGVYVLMQDWRAMTNRLFALFALSAVLLMYCAVLRFTGDNPWGIWFVYGLSAPLLAVSSWLLIWLILAIFIPHRYAQLHTRRALAAPYVLIALFLTLDWYSGLGLVRRTGAFQAAGMPDILNGPLFVPMIVSYVFGGLLVPLAMLITVAVHQRRERVPAVWLSIGLALSFAAGAWFGSASWPALNYVSMLPLYLAFGWVTLRYQVFRPSQVALRTAIEYLPDGVVIIDAQRQVRFANRAARQLALLDGNGRTAFEAALARVGFQDCTTPEDRLDGVRRFHRVGEMEATLMVSEVAIEGDQESASVLLLRDVTAAERQRVALAASHAALEERTAALERSLDEIRQRDAIITRLTLPMIPLSEGVLALPLIGAFTGERSQAMVALLLNQIEQQRAQRVLLDLTGITSFDHSLAVALRQAADGARLMGAQIVLCGVRPDIAESIVRERLEIPGIQYFATMQEGVATLLHQGNRSSLVHQ